MSLLNRTSLESAIKHEGGVSRRLFLAYGAALWSVPTLGLGQSGKKAIRFESDPFQMGIASGDPDHKSVVLWTRVAPKPLEPGGGMANEAVEVIWEIAEDEGMKKIVAKGIEVATPQLAHTVHAEPKGLKPDRWYWYRFRVGTHSSPVGKTRTLPDPMSTPGQMRFAFASCQNYEQGLFTAYEQMAQDNVDLVFHLGDYFYELGYRGRIRKHLSQESVTLDEYRNRFAQYRLDAHLAGMHATCPWFVTWDDHEFDNNCANDISEQKGVSKADFLLRRANSYQAYYEMMPLRRTSIPSGPNMRLYRKASYGRLAEFMVLDSRQYRTDQPNNDRRSDINEAALDPSATLLGTGQRHWLEKSMMTSRGTWNVLAQQVMMGMVDRSKESASPSYSMDQWPGYAAERMRLVQFMKERRVLNPVVLTGDIHSNWVNELRVDDRKMDTDPVATEFVGTSICSGGNGTEIPSDHDSQLKQNPFLKFYNRERGYVVCTLTPKTWTSDYMVTDEVEKPGGKTTKRASFVVESGDPKVKKA